MTYAPKPLLDRSKPPQNCPGCGSDHMRTTHKHGMVWRIYCLDCGHWDEQWVDKLVKK